MTIGGGTSAPMHPYFLACVDTFSANRGGVKWVRGGIGRRSKGVHRAVGGGIRWVRGGIDRRSRGVSGGYEAADMAVRGGVRCESRCMSAASFPENGGGEQPPIMP